jgi:CPA2 family monovalent cation:H+ antiporter-2
MSHELQMILNVTVAIAIALVGGLLAHRLGQSVIVGYLIAGVVVGPFTPGFIADRDQIAALAEVGVIFLMFALGIEFSLKELARIKGVALAGTALQVTLIMACGIGLGALLGWPFQQGLFFGGIIAISSTMVILKTLLDRGEMASRHGRVLLGMLIVQDLMVILLIVVLPKLATDSEAIFYDLMVSLITAGVFIVATLFLGVRVVPQFLSRVERLRSPELFLLTAVTLALGTATVSALLGLSPALGAFLGGLLLTESEFDHRVVAEVVPMRNLFATLFFVSIGMLIDPVFILANLAAVIGIALFIVLVKALATAVAVIPFRLGSKATVFTSLGMIQIGEFSYVLSQAGQQVGAVSEMVNNLILTSSVLTIIATPVAFLLAPHLTALLSRLPIVGDALAGRSAMKRDEVRLENHAIVIGYGRVGRRVVAGLLGAGLPTVVIDEDSHVVQELACRGIPAINGDASYTSILAAAHLDLARLVIVALPDVGTTRSVVRDARQLNPSVPILARVAREEQADVVKQFGASAVVAPEQAGAILLLEESARMLDLHVAVLLDGAVGKQVA